MKYHYLHVHDHVKVVSRPQTPIFSVGTAGHKSKISMYLEENHVRLSTR